MPTCDSSNHYSGLLTMAKKVSKFFRIGVEGDTCDGRVISAQDIQEMAETFDGTPRKIDFTLSLTRVDESLAALYGDIGKQAESLIGKAGSMATKFTGMTGAG
ncbi:TPA: hypothetical protein JLC67_003114 [Escherichia coli]|nr:hypothetical protein [Escherichia coli]